MPTDRLELLTAQIAQGWGESQPDQIPADWRTRRGPDNPHSETRKAAIAAGQSRKWSSRRPTRSFARLKAAAAEMRAKYLNPWRVAGRKNAIKRWKSASRKVLRAQLK